MIDFGELFTYLLALFLVLLIPELYDIHRSYNEKEKLLADAKPLFEEFKQSLAQVREGKTAEPPKLDQLLKLFEKVTAAPEGLEGLGRVVMTLGVIAIIGIAVIHLLLSSSSLINDIISASVNSPMLSNQTLTFAEKASSDQIDIIKTLVTILGSALTTMIGFYFGTKAAEKKSDGATPPSSGEANGNGNGKGNGNVTSGKRKP